MDRNCLETYQVFVAAIIAKRGTRVNARNVPHLGMLARRVERELITDPLITVH